MLPALGLRVVCYVTWCLLFVCVLRVDDTILCLCAGNDGIWCFGGSACQPQYCPTHVNAIQGLYSNLAASSYVGPCPMATGDLWVTKVGVQLSEYCFAGSTPVYIHVTEPGVTIVDDLVVVMSYSTATPPASDFVAPAACVCSG